MEDKNTIIIKDNTYNRFDLYYKKQILTDLKHFNVERLAFSSPVKFKLPSNNITFHRIFVAITGPKPRKIENVKQPLFDVNELLDFDAQIGPSDKKKSTTELEDLDFSSAEIICSVVGDGNYQILIDYDWYKFNVDSDMSAPSFVYNITPNLYSDLPEYNEEITQKFMVFNATELYQENKNLLDEIPPAHYNILVTKKWFKDNLSEKWMKSLEQIRPLTVGTEEVFSFGMKQNTLDVNNCSYQISLCLYDRNNPTVAEIKWAAKYEELAMACKKHLKESPFQKLRLQIDLMKGLTWKENQIGHVDGPKLYPKVLYTEKNGEGMFTTVFREQRVKLPTEKNEEGDEMIMIDGNPTKVNYTTIDDPLTIAEKRGRFITSLKFESIFIGSKVALQVKINDVLIIKWNQPHITKPMIKRSGGLVVGKAIVHPKTSADKSDSEFSNDEDGEVSASKARTVKTVNM